MMERTLSSRTTLVSAYKGGSWKMPSSGGEPEPLAITEDAIGPTLSREGNRLVFTKDLNDSNLWRAGGPSARTKEEPRRLVASTQDEFAAAFSPDGRKIAFGTGRTGVEEVFVAESDGGNPRQLTFFGPDPVLADVPRWSPDGRFIAFQLQRIPDLNADVYVVPSDGGTPRRLTDWPSHDSEPSWSRDGKWIYTSSSKSGAFEVWKLPFEGGTPVQLTREGGVGCRESPDGKFVFHRKYDKPGFFRVPVEGGEEEKLPDTVGPPGGLWSLWDVYDRGLCYVESRPGQDPAVLCHELATGKTIRVMTLKKLPNWGFTVSPDGKWILYDQEDVSGSDLVLVENFR
jgi:Tol biopolymer transport system component